MNKSQSIIQILMSIFSNQVAINENIKLTSSEEIGNELKKAGLNQQQLNFAVTWFENFAKLHEKPIFDYGSSTRVFTNDERSAIPNSCLDFLWSEYENLAINALELEFVIHQAMMLDQHTITEEQFMWVYDMTLANQAKRHDPEEVDVSFLMHDSLYSH